MPDLSVLSDTELRLHYQRQRRYGFDTSAEEEEMERRRSRRGLTTLQVPYREAQIEAREWSPEYQRTRLGQFERGLDIREEQGAQRTGIQERRLAFSEQRYRETKEYKEEQDRLKRERSEQVDARKDKALAAQQWKAKLQYEVDSLDDEIERLSNNRSVEYKLITQMLPSEKAAGRAKLEELTRQLDALHGRKQAKLDAAAKELQAPMTRPAELATTRPATEIPSAQPTTRPAAGFPETQPALAPASRPAAATQSAFDPERRSRARKAAERLQAIIANPNVTPEVRESARRDLEALRAQYGL